LFRGVILNGSRVIWTDRTCSWQQNSRRLCTEK